MDASTSYGKSVLMLAWILGVPGPAAAQSVIDGTVRDLSGGAISGVLVEASSPALIEKTRKASTDEQGRYRIEDLRPGIYTVRFALAGWQPRRVPNVELSGALNARVDVVLGPAAVSAEITVAAVVPAVDVHAVRREVPLTSEARCS